MPSLPSRVDIQEEGVREGFQIEQRAIPTARKLELIDALAAAGLREIQIASFVDSRRVPGWSDAEEVVRTIPRRPGVKYTALWLNVRGLNRALTVGGLHLKALINTSASEPFLIRNQNQDLAANERVVANNLATYAAHGIDYVRVGIMAAFGCNFAGDISLLTVMDSVARMERLVHEAGRRIDLLSLADTMAWANPEGVKRVVGAVRNRWPETRISLHLHDTRGLAIANAYAGLQMGVDCFDASVAGLGGCPFAAHKGAAGNICTEDFVFLCQELGIETGVNLEQLIEAAQLAESIFERPLPGSIMRGGSLSPLRRRSAGVRD